MPPAYKSFHITYRIIVVSRGRASHTPQQARGDRSSRAACLSGGCALQLDRRWPMAAGFWQLAGWPLG
jgi:hypothetical protein